MLFGCYINNKYVLKLSYISKYKMHIVKLTVYVAFKLFVLQSNGVSI